MRKDGDEVVEGDVGDRLGRGVRAVAIEDACSVGERCQNRTCISWLGR